MRISPCGTARVSTSAVSGPWTISMLSTLVTPCLIVAFFGIERPHAVDHEGVAVEVRRERAHAHRPDARVVLRQGRGRRALHPVAAQDDLARLRGVDPERDLAVRSHLGRDQRVVRCRHAHRRRRDRRGRLGEALDDVQPSLPGIRLGRGSARREVQDHVVLRGVGRPLRPPVAVRVAAARERGPVGVRHGAEGFVLRARGGFVLRAHGREHERDLGRVERALRLVPLRRRARTRSDRRRSAVRRRP